MSESSDGIVFFGLCSKDEDVEYEISATILEGEDRRHFVDNVNEILEVNNLKSRISTHCCNELELYYLAIGEQEMGVLSGELKPTPNTFAPRGDPQRFNPITIPWWVEDIKQAAELIGWPRDNRYPEWWVTSWRG